MVLDDVPLLIRFQRPQLTLIDGLGNDERMELENGFKFFFNFLTRHSTWFSGHLNCFTLVFFSLCFAKEKKSFSDNNKKKSKFDFSIGENGWRILCSFKRTDARDEIT